MDENSTWRIFTWQTIIDVDSCLTEVGLTWTPRYHVRGFSLRMRIKGPHKYTLKLHNINLLQCRSFSYIANPKEQTLSISISLLRVTSPTPHITGVHSTLNWTTNESKHSHASNWHRHLHYRYSNNVDFVLFHSVTCYTNSLLSHASMSTPQNSLKLCAFQVPRVWHYGV